MNYVAKGIFFSVGRKMLVVSCVLTVLLTVGCAKKPGSQVPQQVLGVKAMQVTQQDTAVTYEFVGEVMAKEEVQLRSLVSGNLIEKMVSGGAVVSAGQPLFRIDTRQYEASYQNSLAQLAEAEATLSRVRRDVSRYQILLEQQAIAQQVLDNILAEERQSAARVDACRAQAQHAQDDLHDTLLVSPLTGRIDVKDPSVGTFVQAGQTVLATISSVDPILVRFNMSENEYLQFSHRREGFMADRREGLKLRLSDGSSYPLEGTIYQVDRGISQDTGTLTIKAVFNNPDRMLAPGMFARIIAEGEVRKGAMLIPERAVQEMLSKTFVTVANADDKAEVKPVKMGPRVGSFWVVEEGLAPGERVVVEGFMEARPGMALNVTMIGPDDLSIPERK